MLRPYCSPTLLGPVRGKKRKIRPVNTAFVSSLLSTKPLIQHSTVRLAWPAWLKEANLIAAVREQHLSAGPRYDLPSMALNGAIAGLGIALLPEYVAAAAAKAGQIVRISDRSWVADKGYYLRSPEWRSGLVALDRFRHWIRSIR
jgi:LysR family glycine cleavage system transcriptional activator